jgi:hypothetical protein
MTEGNKDRMTAEQWIASFEDKRPELRITILSSVFGEIIASSLSPDAKIATLTGLAFRAQSAWDALEFAYNRSNELLAPAAEEQDNAVALKALQKRYDGLLELCSSTRDLFEKGTIQKRD